MNVWYEMSEKKEYVKYEVQSYYVPETCESIYVYKLTLV
jgi:hypothetical protein